MSTVFLFVSAVFDSAVFGSVGASESFFGEYPFKSRPISSRISPALAMFSSGIIKPFAKVL